MLVLARALAWREPRQRVSSMSFDGAEADLNYVAARNRLADTAATCRARHAILSRRVSLARRALNTLPPLYLAHNALPPHARLEEGQARRGGRRAEVKDGIEEHGGALPPIRRHYMPPGNTTRGIWLPGGGMARAFLRTTGNTSGHVLPWRRFMPRMPNMLSLAPPPGSGRQTIQVSASDAGRTTLSHSSFKYILW